MPLTKLFSASISLCIALIAGFVVSCGGDGTSSDSSTTPPAASDADMSSSEEATSEENEEATSEENESATISQEALFSIQVAEALIGEPVGEEGESCLFSAAQSNPDFGAAISAVLANQAPLSGKEFSLNAQIGEDGDEWQDWLVDKELDHDLKLAHQEEMEQRKDLLKNSIKVLNEREREILYSRRLNDEPTTLEDLSKKFKISRERIRQIENKAFEKLQKHMLNSAKSKNLLPAN